MTAMIDDVEGFMVSCDQLLPYADPAMILLYKELVREEYQELTDAIDAEDEVETLDACMDLIWVLIGLCAAKGYDTRNAWDHLADNNFSKFGPDNKPLRREDGKILKPADWTPPDFSQFIPK